MPADTRHVLLVEDNPNDLELTLSALSHVPSLSRPKIARDGAEALDYVFCRGKYAGRDGGNPALVLLDLKLPKIDGLQVLQQLRASDSTRMIPIVMLTSSREESDLLRSYAGGVNAYVVKPVDLREFTASLRNVGDFWGGVNEPPPR